MSIAAFVSENTVYAGIELIHGRAFIETAIQDICALLPIICSDRIHTPVKCAHFSRFECQLPQIRLAC